jgi:holo-[acyl-carrier protein] synthase
VAIIGIGTDIVKISRIKRVFKKHPKSFPQRLLHPNELKILVTHKTPETYIAKRFAAKEAVAKALGTGIAEGVSFQDIEISNNTHGQPVLTLHGKTLALAKKRGVTKQFISLSDEKKYAIAYVILEN